VVFVCGFVLASGAAAYGYFATSATGASTTIAAGSNNVSLPVSTIHVASTAGFQGFTETIAVVSTSGTETLTCTGSTTTTFTGCTGGTGTLTTNNAVTQAAAQSQAETLGTPGAGSATAPTATTLALSWGTASPLPSGGGYVVLRAKTSGGPYTAVGTGTCAGTISTTSCTDTGLTAGTPYYYEVEAVFDNWVSAPTAQFSANTSYATNGSGTMTVSPMAVLASSTGDTLTFTYTAAAGGLSGGEVDLAVPSSWSTPQTTSASTAGYTAASVGSVAVASGPTIKVTGVTISGGATLTITYGAGGGTGGASAPAATGVNTFIAAENSTGGAVVALATSPTVTVGQGLPFSQTTPGTYDVYVPASHPVTIADICGGGGGGGATASGGTGGGGGCVAGTIPAQAIPYILTVTIAGGGTFGGTGGSGFNIGGAGQTSGPGGGGGGSSGLQVGGTTLVIAGGGGGGSGADAMGAGDGGSGATTSPGSGASGTGGSGGGAGGTGNLAATDGGAGTTGTAAGGGGGGAGAGAGAGGGGSTSPTHSATGGGAGGDFVIGTGAFAPTAVTYSAGVTTAANATGATGSVSLT
jgi:hypothetical protein